MKEVNQNPITFSPQKSVKNWGGKTKRKVKKKKALKKKPKNFLKGEAKKPLEPSLKRKGKLVNQQLQGNKFPGFSKTLKVKKFDPRNALEERNTRKETFEKTLPWLKKVMPSPKRPKNPLVKNLNVGKKS